MLSVVCASMMIGRATAVYYVRASWVRRFAKLNPVKISFSRFWSQSAKYCPREYFNVYGILTSPIDVLIMTYYM